MGSIPSLKRERGAISPGGAGGCGAHSFRNAKVSHDLSGHDGRGGGGGGDSRRSSCPILGGIGISAISQEGS